jgi:hypothetical protein
VGAYPHRSEVICQAQRQSQQTRFAKGVDAFPNNRFPTAGVSNRVMSAFVRAHLVALRQNGAAKDLFDVDRII